MDEVNELRPAVVWREQLRPCGPEDNPGARLLGHVTILGADFHAEAYEVTTLDGGGQAAACDEDETYVNNLLGLVDDDAQTVTIGGREYVFAITPFQR